MAVDLAVMRELFRAAPFAVDLGIEPTACSEGRCESRMLLQPRHLQHTGQAHAGVSTTLADHTMGAAAQGLLAPGSLVLTAELKVSLLRAARGQQLLCTAWVLKPGRQLLFTEAEVHADDGGVRTLVMKASATMAVVPDRRP